MSNFNKYMESRREAVERQEIRRKQPDQLGPSVFKDYRGCIPPRYSQKVLDKTPATDAELYANKLCALANSITDKAFSKACEYELVYQGKRQDARQEQMKNILASISEKLDQLID